MAYVDQFAFTVPAQTLVPALFKRLSQLLETPFDRRYRQRTAEIAALRLKSDADLAAMGIAREDIVAHVFAGRSLC